VGARKAALAKGRRKRVVFIVGGLRVCGQRCASAGRPMAAEELAGAGLTHWVSVCGPRRCAVMELRVEVDGRGDAKLLLSCHCGNSREITCAWRQERQERGTKPPHTSTPTSTISRRDITGWCRAE
jgi:hypothetical protein